VAESQVETWRQRLRAAAPAVLTCPHGRGSLARLVRTRRRRSRAERRPIPTVHVAQCTYRALQAPIRQWQDQRNAEKSIRKHEAGLSQAQIAEALGCSRSTVKRDLRHHRETGEPRESRRGQGKTNDIRWIFAGDGGPARLSLLENVKEAGDAEDLLKEVWTKFLEVSAEEPAYRTLCDAISKLEYTRKLLSSLAREYDEHARDKFLLAVLQLHGAHQLVFTDETARDDRTLNRRYGYSRLGTPASGSTHFLLRGKRYSAMGPFTLDGFLDWKIVEGGFDAER
jgi:biotin operon repressor